MLKVTTKRTTVILLALVMSLGLFVAAYGGDTQDITAVISGSITVTPPDALSDWTLTWNETAVSKGANTTCDSTAPSNEDPHTAKVVANKPYTLSVSVSTSDYPSYETTHDVHMTTSSDGTQIDLTNALELKYNSDGSNGATSTDATGSYSSLSAVTTSGASFVAASAAPDTGTALIGIEHGQDVAQKDPAYGSGSQLNYEIQLSWTASGNVS